jgi:DNA repair protein RadC
MKIKDLCPDDRPREKMLLSGARSLSNAELLAILIGTGTGGKNATEVAREVLSTSDGRLVLLSAMPIERLILQKGIGQAKAITIAAALELGRRSFEEQARVSTSAITSPDLVYQLMLPVMRDLDHEECWVLFLNGKSRLIGKEMISSGSLEHTVIDTRKILRRAIEKQSRHVILVHNHPGGTPQPSQADVRQTDIVRRALAAVEITLTDHVIVSDGQYFSFSEEKFGT